MKELFNNVDFMNKNGGFILEESPRYVYVKEFTRSTERPDITMRYDKDMRDDLLNTLHQDGFIPFDIFNNGKLVKKEYHY